MSTVQVRMDGGFQVKPKENIGNLPPMENALQLAGVLDSKPLQVNQAAAQTIVERLFEARWKKRTRPNNKW